MIATALPALAPTRAGNRSQPAGPVQPESDEALARLAQQGDTEAFGRLVERYQAQARRVARAILNQAEDGDDAAQDALVAAWTKLRSFDAARKFKPWLMRIVANTATDHYRRRKVRRGSPIPDSVAHPAPGPDRAADDALMRDRLRQALEQLSDRHRLAVMMFDGEGFSHGEIAEVLQVPVGTVRSLVFHARRALRNALAPWREE